MLTTVSLDGGCKSIPWSFPFSFHSFLQFSVGILSAKNEMRWKKHPALLKCSYFLEDIPILGATILSFLTLSSSLTIALRFSPLSTLLRSPGGGFIVHVTLLNHNEGGKRITDVAKVEKSVQRDSGKEKHSLWPAVMGLTDIMRTN